VSVVAKRLLHACLRHRWLKKAWQMDADDEEALRKPEVISSVKNKLHGRCPRQVTCQGCGICEWFENFSNARQKTAIKMSIPKNFCNNLTSVGAGNAKIG
jgi:hypothetical protein